MSSFPTKLDPCKNKSAAAFSSLGHPGRAWEDRNQRANVLRSELEEKMDSWRRQGLRVQSESIREAESKATAALEERKEKLASEAARRREKHCRVIEEVEERRQERERESRKASK